MAEPRQRDVTVWRLGRVEYEDGLRLQERALAALRDGTGGESLLLLEHPAVLTLGRAARSANVLAQPEALARAGVRVHETNRGGDVTYHGPGQLVAYPLLDLRPDRQDVRRYIRDLEETVIRTLARLGLPAHR